MDEVERIARQGEIALLSCLDEKSSGNKKFVLLCMGKVDAFVINVGADELPVTDETTWIRTWFSEWKARKEFVEI